MSMESITQGEKPKEENKEEAYFEDADLYEKLVSVKFNAVKGARPDAESTKAQRQEYLTGEIDCPSFTYLKNEGINYQEMDENLLLIKSEMKDRLIASKESGNERDEVLTQSYLWKLNLKIASVRMMREAQYLNNGENLEYHAKKFSRYNEFINGKPELEIFKGTIGKISNELELLKDIPVEKKDAFDRLKLIADNFNDKNPDIDFPEFPNISNSETKKDPELVLDPEVIKEYFEEALKEIGLSEKGWVAKIDETGERFAFAVDTGTKKVLIPMEKHLENRKKGREITKDMIKGLIAHEINTHARRSVNGRETGLRLLSTGLDRYLEGEEGLATYREHQETKPSDFAGFVNYFSAGLAYGLDDGVKKNFGEVANILLDYYSVIENKTAEESRELAWETCYRIFKGTSGKIPGVIYTKDILYRKGNIAMYSLMKKDGSEKIDFDVGKYDPNNSRHITVLVKLGILDEDLLELSKP